MKLKKANVFAGLLLMCTGLWVHAQEQSFTIANPNVSLGSLPQYFTTEMAAGSVTASGCSIHEFFHQTRTEASQFGHGLVTVPRSVVRPSNLKRELPILAATGILIAKVDRHADNRIQSKSLQETAGRWSNVGLGLELGSAALANGAGCREHHSYLRDTGFRALAAMAAAGTVDLGLKLAFDRQFPYTPNSTGKFWGAEGLFHRDTQRLVSHSLPLSPTVTHKRNGSNGAHMRLRLESVFHVIRRRSIFPLTF